MATKLVETKWSIFSRRFVRAQNLPYGCTIALFRKNGRKVRDDVYVKRAKVNSSNVQTLDDDERVTALLAEADGLLSMNVAARKLRLGLLAPDGSEIIGRTKLKTVRAMSPKPTPDDIVAAETRAALIEEVAGNAERQLRDASHGIDDDDILPRAYLKAIVDVYGLEAVHQALGDLA